MSHRWDGSFVEILLDFGRHCSLFVLNIKRDEAIPIGGW
jgi:hypothetical protein